MIDAVEARSHLLTGGASRNDAIAQVAADVFQSKVKRLAISGIGSAWCRPARL